jgi:hypothetical protein
VTNNGNLTEYTFTGNGNFTFEYKDTYGNTGSTAAIVTWIDTTPPTCGNTWIPEGNERSSGSITFTLS